MRKTIDTILLKYWALSGAKACKYCRSRQELSNEHFLTKFGVDTEENEPYKVWSFGWKIRVGFDIEPFNQSADEIPQRYILAVDGLEGLRGHLLVPEVEDDEDDGDDVLDEVLPVAVPSEDAQELIAGVLDLLLGEGPRKARNLRLF